MESASFIYLLIKSSNQPDASVRPESDTGQQYIWILQCPVFNFEVRPDYLIHPSFPSKSEFHCVSVYCAGYIYRYHTRTLKKSRYERKILLPLSQSLPQQAPRTKSSQKTLHPQSYCGPIPPFDICHAVFKVVRTQIHVCAVILYHIVKEIKVSVPLRNGKSQDGQRYHQDR